MFNLILAESALELVPSAIFGHPSVIKHAQRRDKGPDEILLDRSYHHSAMIKLKNASKRGRPDIVHFCLLEALGSPLNKAGLLRTFVHTINDYIIFINPEIRLPRNYDRFVGLIEQLYQNGKIPEKGHTLLEIHKGSLNSLIKKIDSDYVVAFTRLGKPKTMDEVAFSIREKKSLVIIVGGFPHGHFSNSVIELANESISVDKAPLEAWTVVSRVVYEIESKIGLCKERLE